VGHEIHVLSLHDGECDVQETLANVNVTRVPLRNIYWPYGPPQRRRATERALWQLRDVWNRQTGKRVRALLDAIQPDVVHTNNIKGLSVSVWGAAASAGIPIVHTLRDYSLMCARGSMFRNGENCRAQCIECIALTTLKSRASTKVNVVVSNSHFTLARHREAGFFRDVPSRVVFNIGQDVSQKLATTDPNVLTFGYIARVEEAKGIEIVLEALKGLKAANWRLVVAGAGKADYVRRLQDRYVDERITWLGFVSENDFYDIVDVCLVPSLWHEPLPRGLIECFSYGRAAIYSDVGGNQEIGRLGKLARKYPGSDISALAELLNEALDHIEDWKTQGGFANPADRVCVAEETIVSKYVGAYCDAIRYAQVRNVAS
jgi:glycosyltransferase involved in cell wall biosynthesis